MHLQAQARTTTCVFVGNRNQPLPPSFGQNRRFFHNAMRIVPKGLMKWRALTNAAIDQIRIRWISKRKNIGLDGDEQFVRSIWELAENGLAANNYKSISSSNASRGPNEVL